MADKIKLNTDFLDEDEKPANRPARESSSTNTSSQPNYNNSSSSSSNSGDGTNGFVKLLGFIGRNFFWLFLGFIFLVGAFSGNNNSSSSSSSNSSNTNYNNTSSDTTSNTSSSDDKIETGDYSCSSYYHDEAGKLEPSSFEKITVQGLKDEIERIDNEGKALKSEIDLYPLDKYSQISIDGYNLKIDQFNALIKESDEKMTEYDTKRAVFNQKVNTYNNYLITNCTKR